MKIEEIRIDEISNHPTNPKIHPDTQIKLLQKSIKRFGWTNPVILAADNTILAGHARVKAAIAAGNDTVPAIRTKLTGKEADAYLVADNRLTEIAQYNRDVLSELLSDLPDDLAELTGFDSVQVEALLSGEDIPDIEKFISDSQPEEPREEVDAEPQIDRAAELNKIWQVQTGDLWQCGEHRLICGDCTDPAVVERVMMGEKADLVLTDPPYGMNWKWGGASNKSYNGTTKAQSNKFTGVTIAGDDTPDASFLDNIIPILNPNCALYLFSIWSVETYWKTEIESRGLIIKNRIIWAKNYFGAGDLVGAYGPQHETIFFATNGKHTLNGVRIGDIWNNKDTTGCIRHGKQHPMEKPVDLICIGILKSSLPEQIVLDPFLGSGTTLIACENTGRKCRGIEISPDYCAVILQRFKDATGKEPVRIEW